MEPDTIDTKKRFTVPQTLKMILITGLTTLVIIGLVLGVLWNKRADIFKYFASEYARQVASVQEKGTTEETVHDNVIAALEEATSVAPEAVKEDSPNVESAVQKANPAVVAITITKTVLRLTGYEEQEVGSGSGFVVSADGMIITNKHVVSDPNAKYTVVLTNGTKYPATVLARDTVLDIAVVKINAANLPYIELGNSDSLKLGQSVIAIGNALGQFQNTISVGIVSGLSRSIIASGGGVTEALDHVIQTDAAINPGNSGGPLLDLSGKVVGVNTAVVQGSQNIGFALPINNIKGVIESVRISGKIIRPYLGIRFAEVSVEYAQKNNLPVTYGVQIKKGSNGEVAVMSGSPAALAGLVEGDIIISFDGVQLDGDYDLSALIRQRKVGQKVEILYVSKGVQKRATVTLVAAPEN